MNVDLWLYFVIDQYGDLYGGVNMDDKRQDKIYLFILYWLPVFTINILRGQKTDVQGWFLVSVTPLHIPRMPCFFNFSCNLHFCFSVDTALDVERDRGCGAVVKAACLVSREIADSKPTLAFQVSKKQNVFSPLTRKDSIFWRVSVTERYRARLQTTRARIMCLAGSVISFISPSSGGTPCPV